MVVINKEAKVGTRRIFETKCLETCISQIDQMIVN